MAQEHCDSKRMLHVYLHDYLRKQKLIETAKTFDIECGVPKDPTKIDSPGGFLVDWWSIFWDTYMARSDATATAYVEAIKMLDVYIYDYLMKENLVYTAHIFGMERNMAKDVVVSDAPKGFLFEWWYVFWEIFISRTNEGHYGDATAYLKLQDAKNQSGQIQQRDPNHPAHNIATDRAAYMDRIVTTHAASNMTPNLLDERFKNRYSESSQIHDINRTALLNSLTNHQWQLEQGRLSTGMQQIQAQPRRIHDANADLGTGRRSLHTDQTHLYNQGNDRGKSVVGVNADLGVAQGYLHVDQSPLYNQRNDRGKSVVGTGTNQSAMPFKGYQWMGCSSLNPQVHRPFSPPISQLQILEPPPQQMLAQMQAQGSPGSSHGYVEMDSRIGRVLPSVSLSGKDGARPSRNDASTGFLMQSSSCIFPEHQTECFVKPSQLLQEQLPQQHQIQRELVTNQEDKKRKAPYSGSFSSPPLTPSSTHGDQTAIADALPHEKVVIRTTDGMDVLASSPKNKDNVENFGCSLDENMDFFNELDAENGKDNSNGLLFEDGGFISSSNRFLCCDFSTNGKLLAGAGLEQKVFILRMENMKTESSPQEHMQMITDVRFRPESTQLATSSFDTTVRLWDANKLNSSLHVFSGHKFKVASLDFHPRKTDLLCSCDYSGEMRLWNVDQCSGSIFASGGSSRVRFQPGFGQFLAASQEKVVSIFDLEKEQLAGTLEGHKKDIQYISWGVNGNYLATVSHDVLNVWSMASGKCVHELKSDGNNFYSCVFHPTFPNSLVIGGYKSLQIWDFAQKRKIMSEDVHGSLIKGLAKVQTESGPLIASASYDKHVRVWKSKSTI